MAAHNIDYISGRLSHHTAGILPDQDVNLRMTEQPLGLMDDPTCKLPSGDIFRKIFEKIQTAILIIDPEAHRIVDANPIAEHITGRARAELIGSMCHQHVCPAKHGECPITDYHEEVHNREWTIINQNGENIPILKTVAKVDIKGKEYLIESFIDITDRKKAEERQAALIAYLSESILRVKKPLELMHDDLGRIASLAAAGDYDAEDIRMQLQIHANNLDQIVRNLEELQEKAVSEKPVDIPPEFRDFLRK